MQKQTDNSNLDIKLQLRRRYLERYGGTACLDCCQGNMELWKVLRKEYPNIKYMGVDKKKKSGRHKINSERLLDLNNQQWDIIDIDTYGNPWKHYFKLYRNLISPTTVFLTYGHAHKLASAVQYELKEMLGIHKKTPQTLVSMAADLYIPVVLHSCNRYGIIAHDITHVRQSGTVEYYALRLEPQGDRS